ncbi:MAG: calcium-translocating P-type ATPase, PMCA-type [Candidatus Omnitrophota bacterium]|nr:calcium-translocating P-type ATPase, PMCA-type [Candidatus Omnitrophota bacterium]
MITKTAEGKWWCLPTEDVCRSFEANPEKGLSAEQARVSAEKFGPNELPKQKGISPLKLFIEQFTNVIIGVLLGAAAIAGILGEWIDTIAILVIVLLNGILGFVQEYRAEKSLEALRKMSSPSSKVLREGAVQLIPSKEIVPGDLVLLEAGDRIPADGRLLKSVMLRTQEAALTGESVPLIKTSETIAEEDLPLGDRKNMVFMGTTAVSGKGTMLVTAIALSTELGKIAAILQTAGGEKTPLQERLSKLGKQLVGIFLVVVSLVFVLGMMRGHAWGEMLLTALSLAVAAIPEGLPAVVTISLAFGVWKMVKRNALVRRLPSVETLGCAGVICSDKTGTLTKNEMTVRAVWVNEAIIHVTGAGYAPEGKFDSEPPELLQALKIAVLCNDASLKEAGKQWEIVGDPTEAALLVAGAKASLWKEVLEKESPILEEVPFDSERKRMSVLRKTSEGPVLFVKGAPDIIMGRCSEILINGEKVPLSEEHRRRIEEANHGLASQALRVLGVAYRHVSASEPEQGEALEQNLVFAGLIAMMDPPRPEAVAAIETCRKAGIRPVMITGDHKITALAVAKELGLADDDARALDGAELNRMSSEEIKNVVEKVSIYARVSAEHKLKVVRAWRELGYVVAMTGDGVNDAPAIKEADIGIAMGITGTDVTKEVSDMVIMDDNFASIVGAVEEGRGIYDNIVKFVKFLLAFNLAEILVLLLGIMIGFTDKAGKSLIPLSALQILWMNLVTDGLPAIALGIDPLDPHAMNRPPREARASMFSRNFVTDLAVISVIVAAGALVACWWGARESAEMAQTMTLTTLVLLELVGVQMVRAAYHIKLFSNLWLVAALAVSIIFQLLILYIPPLQNIFHLVPLGVREWGVILLISGVVYTLGYVIRRFFKLNDSDLGA